MVGEKRDTFTSQALIEPPEEMSMSLKIVWQGGGIKNNARPKTPDWYTPGEEAVADLRRHPSIEGRAVKNVSHNSIL